MSTRKNKAKKSTVMTEPAVPAPIVVPVRTTSSYSPKLKDPESSPKIKLYHPTNFTKNADVILVQKDNENNIISRIAAHKEALQQIPFFEPFFSKKWKYEPPSQPKKKKNNDDMKGPEKFEVSVPATSQTLCGYMTLFYKIINGDENTTIDSFDKVCDYFKLADFFNDKHQLETLSSVIRGMISVDNLVKVYVLGESVRKACEDFIRNLSDNKFKALLGCMNSNKEYKELTNSGLMRFFELFNSNCKYSDKRENLVKLSWIDSNKRHKNFEDVFYSLDFRSISEILGYRLMGVLYDNFEEEKANRYCRRILEGRTRYVDPKKSLQNTLISQYEYCMNFSKPEDIPEKRWAKFPRHIRKNANEIVFVQDKADGTQEYKRFVNPKIKEKTKNKKERNRYRSRLLVNGEVNSLAQRFSQNAVNRNNQPENQNNNLPNDFGFAALQQLNQQLQQQIQQNGNPFMLLE